MCPDVVSVELFEVKVGVVRNEDDPVETLVDDSGNGRDDESESVDLDPSVKLDDRKLGNASLDSADVGLMLGMGDSEFAVTRN